MTESDAHRLCSTSTCRPTASRCGRLSPRDAARLLVVRPGGTPELEDRGVRDLPDLLAPGDALVVNDTKVIPARLTGRRIGRGARAEDRGDADEAPRRLALARLRAAGEEARRGRRRPLRRGGQGVLPRPARRDGRRQGRGRRGDAVVCVPRRGARPGDRRARRHAAAALYRRASARPTSSDRADYQTLFAREEGSVAAPTAGLHFTDDLLARLAARGRRAARGDAACRAGHVPAGAGRRHRGAQDACGARGA